MNDFCRVKLYSVHFGGKGRDFASDKDRLILWSRYKQLVCTQYRQGLENVLKTLKLFGVVSEIEDMCTVSVLLHST
jgi:hypothetical protein